MKPCPCNSGKDFAACCGLYLEGEQAAPTAEALMRSRYSAFVHKNYNYIVDTFHASTRPVVEEFKDAGDINWTGLEIIKTEAGLADDVQGMVEFVASCQNSGRTYTLHEKSNFIKEEGQWFYVDGEVMTQSQARSEKVGRNEPCPCGSGKKFKKCCYK